MNVVDKNLIEYIETNSNKKLRARKLILWDVRYMFEQAVFINSTCILRNMDSILAATQDIENSMV